MRSPTPVVVAAVVILATAACTPSSPSTSHTPVTGYLCPGPTPGAPERKCSKDEFDKAQADANLFAEASQVYQDLTREMDRIAAAGGSPEPTDEMRRLTTGTFLTMMAGVARHQFDQGERSTGAVEITHVMRLPDREGAVVVLGACEDGRNTSGRGKDGQTLAPGRLTRTQLEFLREGTQLKIFKGTAKADDQCGA